MAKIFSDDQALSAEGDTPSTRLIDLMSKDAPTLVGQCIAVSTGTTGLTFAGSGGLQIVLQSSLNGTTWNDFSPLTPRLSNNPLSANQLFARRAIPKLGGAKFIRLVYRVGGAVPTGRITADLVPLPVDRFGYQPSGFEVA
jgi:hypothetical protein